MTMTGYDPPTKLSRAEIVRLSEDLLCRPDIPLDVHEEIVPIVSLGLEWDIACKVFRPVDEAQVPRGADGRKVGFFLLHGGQSDHRRFDNFAPLLAGKLGYHVVCMTYPGRLYMDDPSRDWPGDTIRPDGTARMPQWKTGRTITPDQYEVIRVVPPDDQRRKWGTLFFAEAKQGTEFYDRMAAWPAAFEDGMRELCRLHFPPETYTIYVHGHSTGGPFAHALLQRVANVGGLAGIESSPFGSLFGAMSEHQRNEPFYYLGLRTWRDIARYKGFEAGAEAYRSLPMLMEEVFEHWDQVKTYPQFKAEWILHYGMLNRLAEAARAAARRLGLNIEETEALVTRYHDLTRPMTGAHAKPVPPILYGVTATSADHKPEKYRGTVLPALAKLRPAPKTTLVCYEAGVHDYSRPEEGLPFGVGAAAACIWADAIADGYYLTNERTG